ncbi:SDR family oxidoreductase [Natronomonas sp. EA1]|uniref:SDR family oxidoreductase n=1 Tax=Natronomonas sp. EA1 TaxID=3421655 RepID=UPI003EBDC33A
MNRTVLATGCSSGIGRATAEVFLDEEWTVYATARDTDDIADLDEKGAVVAELDVTDEKQCKTVVNEAVAETGRLDVLVNNAGYGQHGPLEDLRTKHLHEQFDVNVYGPHRLTRAALPHMREAEEGTIINVSSVAGRVAVPGMGAYSGSKFALEGMSDALRNEVSGFGVDVVLVEPGPVETEFRNRVGEELKKYDRTEAYENLYEMQEDAGLLSGQSSPFASTAEEVAEVILEAGVSPDPKPRYVVGGFAQAVLYTRLLPATIRDKLFGLFRTIS